MKTRRTIVGLAIVWAWCAGAPARAHTASPTHGSISPSSRYVAQADQQVMDCPPGMVLINGTNCCWPGQRFSKARGTCKGSPVCPAGMVASGASCVAASAVPPPQPAAPPPPPPPPAPVAAPPPQPAPPPMYSAPYAAPLYPMQSPGYPPPVASPAPPPAPPAAAPPGSQGTCFPPCRAGYLCWGGQCVSACNPPCGAGEQCAADGSCVSSSAGSMGMGAGPGFDFTASGASTGSGAGDGGWARTAGYLGIGTMVLLGGLTAAIAANTDDEDVSIPLGIAATVFGGAMIPVVAAGASSARTSPMTQGYPGLRLASWIVYGITMADAVLAIGLGLSDVEVPPAMVASIGLLGVASTAGMTWDAFASASPGASLARGQSTTGIALSPFLGPVGGREPHGMVLGFRGSL